MKNGIKKKIIIIGAGRLGTSVADGFLKSGVSNDQIVFIQRDKSKKRGISAFQVFETLNEANIDET